MNYEVFVGQNNETKKLELDKIIEITAQNYDGATFSAQGLGIYKGEVEKSITIIINSDKETLERYMKQLKIELRQEFIGYRQSNEVKFY